jgi:hypothetical protein
MEEINELEFEVQVIESGATDEELDGATRQLLSELRELNVESVELVRSEAAPAGTKGDPVTLGAISLTVLPVAIPSIITFIQTWVMRKQGRTVKFKGKGIEFEGSPEEFQKLLDRLAIEKKGK